jgi:hypothetical protein
VSSDHVSVLCLLSSLFLFLFLSGQNWCGKHCAIGLFGSMVG